MAENTSNKTIAKNTLFLYIRSFLIMAISLLSSRVILQVLGVKDYGLYGAIGSIVSMFSMINGVLSAGSSRFLTFELGRGDKERLRKTFSASFTMHLTLSIILFILMETIGLWFVNNKMNIPDGRYFAANVVYQVSVLTCMLSLTQVPYSASIIAHEKMNVYAYVGIVEVCFKLALIFALLYVPFTDKLIAYAVILALWSIGLQLWYRHYCNKRFEETKLLLVREKNIYKGMLSYSLWDFVGQFCSTGNTQGLNVLINMFFGVTMNAARAVASQVETAVMQFSNNFLTAVNPQITKSYAKGDNCRFISLIKTSSKLSFFLLYVISFPFVVEAKYVLSVWLVEVPPATVAFVRFSLIYSLFRIVTRPFVTGTHATGHIKYLNLTAGLYSACTFLLAIYIAYSLGAPYWSCFLVYAINGTIITYFEINSLKKEIYFSLRRVLIDNYLKPWGIVLISCILPIVEYKYMQESLGRFIVVASTSILLNIVLIYFLGLNSSQRNFINGIIKTKIKR